MIDESLLVAGALFLSLVLYVLTGGADFGGGAWDLFASGPRRDQQRDLTAHALAPIWETNNVWLIIVVVLCFVCFPKAYSAISIALHIPVTLMLFGIVLRGSAFVFRAHVDHASPAQRRWNLVFAVSSTVTPFFLGLNLAAITSGKIQIDADTGVVTTNFISDWATLFGLSMGILVCSVCCYLSAIYLIFETDDDALKSDFRTRALIAAISVGICAGFCLLVAKFQAPYLYKGLTQSDWAIPFQVTTGVFALAVIALLCLERYFLARAFAMLHVITILSGWALAQYPYIISPSLTFADAAAPRSILTAVLIALAAGCVILVPSLSYLYIVFKRKSGRSMR